MCVWIKKMDMSRIWNNQVTWFIHESHIRMSHVTHTWMSRVTSAKLRRYTCICVMWKKTHRVYVCVKKDHTYVTYMKESSDLIHSWVTHMNDSCHINEVIGMRRLFSHHKYTRVNFSPHHIHKWVKTQKQNTPKRKLYLLHTKFYDGQFLFFSRYTYVWVTSHVCMSSVTRIKKSWYSCERVMSHMWTGHLATHMNESCHTYDLCHTHERVMSHIWVMPYIWTSHVTHMSHATHMNEPCHAYETCHIYERVMSHIWVMPHTWTSHVTPMGYATHMNESCQCAPMRWLQLVGSFKL